MIYTCTFISFVLSITPCEIIVTNDGNEIQSKEHWKEQRE